jgi:hypothetical protein
VLGSGEMRNEGDASGTRGAMKAITYADRVIIKKADRRPRSLRCGAGMSGASCRVLPAPSIGSCRAGAGAGAPAIFWARGRADMILGAPVRPVFSPRAQLRRQPRFGRGFGLPVEML